MRATQLTDFGTDQSPMMTGHSSKIRTKWNNATTAKITPATRENVFASMSDPPKVLFRITLKEPANAQRTKWDEIAPPVDFSNTNQYLSAQNEMGRDDYHQISSAVLSTSPVHASAALGIQPSQIGK
jgi:hypothetical protein